MKWRGVRVAVALLLLCAPAAGDAQPSTKMPRIGLMSVGTDPARPLSPYTWVAFLDAAGIGEKYAELLREAVPSARALNVVLVPIAPVKGPEEFEPFLVQAKRARVDALVVTSDGVTNVHRQLVVNLAAKHRMPAIFPVREFVDAGGLMSYGPTFADLFRRAPVFVDKILKGARPADLPMEQPTKFELVVNLETARLLGLSISPALLARAEQVLQ